MITYFSESKWACNYCESKYKLTIRASMRPSNVMPLSEGSSTWKSWPLTPQTSIWFKKKTIGYTFAWHTWIRISASFTHNSCYMESAKISLTISKLRISLSCTFEALLGVEQAWTPIIYLKSFDMDSVQVEKAVFVKVEGTRIWVSCERRHWT